MGFTKNFTDPNKGYTITDAYTHIRLTEYIQKEKVRFRLDTYETKSRFENNKFNYNKVRSSFQEITVGSGIEKPQIQKISWDIDFESGNVIDGEINDVAITQVPFNTDQATTLADIATEIQNNTKVEIAVITGAREITVTGHLAVSIPLSDFLVTGGTNQAIDTITETQALVTGVFGTYFADGVLKGSGTEIIKQCYQYVQNETTIMDGAVDVIES